jgi:hypothetical protein
MCLFKGETRRGFRVRTQLAIAGQADSSKISHRRHDKPGLLLKTVPA